MTPYQKRPTQEQRILSLLRNKGSQGVFVYEMIAPRPQGLGIAQYNARIWGLRQKGYEIKNINPGHFLLTRDIEFDENGQGSITLQ